jgi:hypothetical protein
MDASRTDGTDFLPYFAKDFIYQKKYPAEYCEHPEIRNFSEKHVP